MFTQTRKFRIGGFSRGKSRTTLSITKLGDLSKEELPHRVDLRQHMTEVEAQVGNSCVANAFVGAYEHLAKRDLGDAADVSRLFVYYNARSQTGSHSEDGGPQMYRAMAGCLARRNNKPPSAIHPCVESVPGPLC